MNQLMKRIGYILGLGGVLLFSVLFGVSTAEACTTIGPASISPANPAQPAPIAATLSSNVSGCLEGDEIRLQFQIDGTTVGTILSVPVPEGVTGTLSFNYEFTAGNDPACSNGQCDLTAQVSIVGRATAPQTANMTYTCSDVACGTGPGSPVLDFGIFNPDWSVLPGAGDETGDGPGQTNNFARLQNPIQYDNIPDVIRQLITIVFVIGVPLVALAIIYAGFLLVTAGGDQNKLTKGKQALLAGVIGGAVLLGAWVIAEAIQGTVDQIRGV